VYHALTRGCEHEKLLTPQFLVFPYGCNCIYVNWLFCSLKMHDESNKRQKVDDDVQEGALPPYLLDRDQTQRAKVDYCFWLLSS
jgi:hypothetical protein